MRLLKSFAISSLTLLTMASVAIAAPDEKRALNAADNSVPFQLVGPWRLAEDPKVQEAHGDEKYTDFGFIRITNETGEITNIMGNSYFPMTIDGKEVNAIRVFPLAENPRNIDGTPKFPYDYDTDEQLDEWKTLETYDKTTKVEGSEHMAQALDEASGALTAEDEAHIIRLGFKPRVGIMAYNYTHGQRQGTFAEILGDSEVQQGTYSHNGLVINNDIVLGHGLSEPLPPDVTLENMGARTANQPLDYHDLTNGVAALRDFGSYPAPTFILKYKGAKSQVMLNMNAIYVAGTINDLNGSPEFADDYERDKVTISDVKQFMDYYRAWIDPEFERAEGEGPFIDLIKSQPELFSYCAEFVKDAMVGALNIEHSEEGFIKIWGEDGKKLFKMWSKAWMDQNMNQRYLIPKGLKASTAIPAGSIEMLWEKEGLSSPYSQDLAEKIKIADGKGMPWRMWETTDIVFTILDSFSRWSWNELNAVHSVLGLMKFAEVFEERNNLDSSQYIMNFAMPVATKMLNHDIATQLIGAIQGAKQIPDGEVLAGAFAQMSVADVKSVIQKIAAKYEAGIADKLGSPDLASQIMQGVNAQKILKIAKKLTLKVGLNAEGRRALAYENFKKQLEPEFKAGRLLSAGTGGIEYNSPPLVISFLAQGRLNNTLSEFVEVVYAGTGIGAQETVKAEDPAVPTVMKAATTATDCVTLLEEGA